LTLSQSQAFVTRQVPGDLYETENLKFNPQQSNYFPYDQFDSKTLNGVTYRSLMMPFEVKNVWEQPNTRVNNNMTEVSSNESVSIELRNFNQDGKSYC